MKNIMQSMQTKKTLLHHQSTAYWKTIVTDIFSEMGFFSYFTFSQYYTRCPKLLGKVSYYKYKKMISSPSIVSTITVLG